MAKGLLFWLLVILSIVFGLGPWWPLGGRILEFILICLLGWKTFGPPLQG